MTVITTSKKMMDAMLLLIHTTHATVVYKISLVGPLHIKK
jgi:hypothetical protein